jgi:hypothetical protein
MGGTGYPETSVLDYHYMLRNFPEERRFQLEGNFVCMGYNLYKKNTEQRLQIALKRKVYCKQKGMRLPDVSFIT